MNYVKFKDGTKERCLKILSRIVSENDFAYLLENMLEETERRAEEALVDMPVDLLELPVTQGVARSFRELTKICRNSREVLEKMSNKNKPSPRP